jgi:glycosyltransferase involved in cell wall biosynthesis
MKKILIFSLAYYPHVGGAEIAIKEITERIPEVEWHLITLRFGREARREKVGSVEVYRIGFDGTYLSKIFFVPLAAFKAYSLNRRQKFDVLWAMMSYMLFPIVLLRFFGVRLPYMLTLQEGDPYARVFGRWFVKPLTPLLRYGFRHAGIVQAISSFLASWARLQGYKGEVEVIPNGVDAEYFAKAHNHFEVRKRLGIQESEPVLVTSSRLVHKNAVDDIVRAMPGLPGVHLLILGTGPEEKILKELTTSLGVVERVRFLGHVSHSELPAYLQAATIFVRPSRSEGMGNSFIEAMASRIPVIATREGGLADFIYDKETAFVVEKDSPEQVVGAVKYILSNPSIVRRVIENAHDLVFTKYDWKLVARKMQERVFARLG